MKTLAPFFILVHICVTTLATSVTHGPMIGHVTDTSARIWIRAKKACRFQVTAVSEETSIRFHSNEIDLLLADNYCGSVVVRGLSAISDYSYEILLDGQPQPITFSQHFRTFPKPGDEGIVRVGFGHSLPKRAGPQEVWSTIGRMKPDLFLLMGDNIYSNTTDPAVQRNMYLEFRNDPFFRPFAAKTPIYAVWDDHDFGINNSDRTQPGKAQALNTFLELWPNPPLETQATPGIWSKFSVGKSEFYLLDVRYHRSPNNDPDDANKTMLGTEQLEWFKTSMKESEAVFRFPVSGSSWNCGGVESWNHRFTYEYDNILRYLKQHLITGVILLGGDQHELKIAVRPRESWGGYDLHEWMAGRIWSDNENHRGFGIITIDTQSSPTTATLEFFDDTGQPKAGTRVLYTTPGALRAMWDSPPDIDEVPPRSADGELRPATSGAIWESLPKVSSETLKETDLKFDN